MKGKEAIITILGSAGGLARSVLAILNKSIHDEQDPIHNTLLYGKIHLIDVKQKQKEYYNNLFPYLYKKFVFHEFDLKDTSMFKKHLETTKSDIVIDVSWADTVEMLTCCNELGVKYVNSALENTFVDENEDLFEGFPLMERIKHFEKYKKSFSNTTSIVCSGMNPGVVQWMAIELLNKYPQEQPLACYIVEQDTSFFKEVKNAKENVIYTSWSPECFLDEAIMSYPMFVQHHTPLFFYEKVYDLEFKVSLGRKQFYGCLMPHEEVYTLCQLYEMEGGFLYQVNDHTTKLIRSQMDDLNQLWDHEMQVLDPLGAPLAGEDLIGVLLVYKDKERYMYNVLSNEDIFSQYKTNATYFQVACGIYASLSVLLLDEIPNGVYYVEELLLKTKNRFTQYLTHYMTDFVSGENRNSDGLLLQRMRKFHD
ncbi:saccharopine dehydrogenase NADP-binding domain-containing protein [Fictibacillus enclensis]|uniref:saccharopine dehydrogenase NADP-binding domain-containing protein n=1 Tax=Fictibacillus enclensis TaxID=1017270 RepID=UPI0025A04869|nr:saccharopine dehydrogenase NADP-binding domain-containing protein [Fictibacillus enclensis]MDM5340496.1 saccharopine dehydrogenase NADP-binding domain-containing protein [Fictibacillus enclensis]